MKIDPIPTSIAAFVGSFAAGPETEPVYVGSVRDLEATFGSEPGDAHDAVVQFFANGGSDAWVLRGDAGDLSALDAVDVISILALPDMRHAPSAAPILEAATAYCRGRRAFFIADPPAGLSIVKADAIAAARSEDAAIYFPDLVLADHRTVAPSGSVAGIYARTPPWKAPAGRDFALRGVSGVSVPLRADQSTALAQAGINPIRLFSDRGTLVWGARTMSDDPLWRYVSIRRLAIFLEESIDRGLQSTTFEPNGPALWASITAAVEDFLLGLWRDGAFAGRKPEEAFFVRCDADDGVVNVEVGFAPVKPAEFLIIRIPRSAPPPA